MFIQFLYRYLGQRLIRGWKQLAGREVGEGEREGGSPVVPHLACCII